jgi:hypothetical protein
LAAAAQWLQRLVQAVNDDDCRLRRYLNLQTKNGASSIDRAQALFSALKMR